MLALGLVAAVTAVACCYRKGSIFIQMLCVALGAFTATTFALFLVGPGNLWPIVLVIDGVMIVVAVAIGGLLGYALQLE